MPRVAILRLLDGDLNQGVQVVLTINTWHSPVDAASEFDAEKSLPSIDINGTLPPNASLANIIKEWQSNYRCLGASRMQPNSVTYDASIHRFRSKCRQLEKELRSQFHAWLSSESFLPIRDKWLTDLVKGEVQVLIRTYNQALLKLPWQVWDLIEQNPLAKVSLSIPDAEVASKPKTRTQSDRLKILAILGNSEGIDIEHDRLLLEGLAGAETTFLVEPTRLEINDQLWEQNWDILFFAGHSRTEGEQGRIYINATEGLTIADLKNAVKKAADRGLWLAIFNSCDGLGLALELQKLKIPQIIVMREPVPDRVAQAFLTYFLPIFVENRSLYQAERDARLRLQGLEDEFPCASWLPVIFQNAAITSLQQTTESLWRRLGSAVLVSVAIAVGVLGVRQLGVFQQLELQALDKLQQLRPSEKPDPRLLVVAVTESDLQKRKEWPLSDRTLSQVLAKLEQYQPQAIGLDIYRDFPVPKMDQAGHQELLPHLLSPRLIAVCAAPTPGKEGLSAPPMIPPDRLGFSDVVVDEDGILRRHLLAMQPNLGSPCPTTEALSFQLALHYLAARGIQPQFTEKEEYQINNVTLTPLSTRSGGYRKLDKRGYQVFLNYRAVSSPEQVAKQVSLSEILNNQVSPELVRGKIVLIGVTAESVHDNYLTPPGSAIHPQRRLPGVLVQAHMVSQILGAVLDQRPLLWVWSDWAEGLWIMGWSVVGGALAVLVRSRFQIVLAIGAAVVVLIAICWGSLLIGEWMPLAPSVLTLLLTGSIVFVVQLQVLDRNRKVLGNL
jgi:CHASE2 domain-containing sensor protein